MHKHRVFFLKMLLSLLMVINISGCWDRHELNTLTIVSGLGIDKAKDPGKIQLTTQIIKTAEIKSSQEGGSGGKKPYSNLTSTGETVFDAIKNYTHECSRKIYLPHNKILIFSHDIAKEGVKKYVDFFIRDPESRRLVKVLVSKGNAKEILESEKGLEEIPGIGISRLVDANSAISEASNVNLQEFLTRLMSKTTAPIASLIEVVDHGKEKIARLTGTAVFKTDKLAGYLNETETRGLLWVIDKIKSGIIVVKSPNGKDKISLQITRASSEIIPEVKDNEVCITVKIDEEGNLGENMSSKDLTALPEWASLEEAQADVIRQEVMAALKKAQELNTDIFGFGDAVHRKYPEQWDELEKQWEQYFPDLKVEVIVNANLSRSGMVKQ